MTKSPGLCCFRLTLTCFYFLLCLFSTSSFFPLDYRVDHYSQSVRQVSLLLAYLRLGRLLLHFEDVRFYLSKFWMDKSFSKGPKLLQTCLFTKQKKGNLVSVHHLRAMCKTRIKTRIRKTLAYLRAFVHLSCNSVDIRLTCIVKKKKDQKLFGKLPRFWYHTRIYKFSAFYL